MINNQKHDSIITLGVFDGIHRGHISILDFIKQTQYQRKIVLIFHPHPKKILEAQDVEYIIPTKIRVSMLKQMGFDDVFVVEFNKQLSQLSGEEFIGSFLIKKYNCKHFVVGFNAHFGKGRDVTTQLLPTLGELYGIKVTICEGVIYKGEPISSTRIRKVIKEGGLYDAMQMLGRPFFIEGTIEKGAGLGATTGFPTLNIQYETEQLLPPVGVYFGFAHYHDTKKPAMINLGFKPTVKENLSHPVLEVYIVNEQVSTTPEKVRVEFIEKIRDEKKFNSLEELKQQLEKDKKYVLNKFLS
ncbi:MAG: bifunctional riboflavin kinase/FAD synthetase [Planctomycetota bacterium]